MNEKVLHTLEFDKIAAQLSGFCGSEPAARMCLSLRPSGNAAWIEAAQAATQAAFARLLKSDRISFGANFDSRALLKDAQIGRCLSMEELLRISRLLACMEDAVSYDAQSAPEEGDALSSLFADIVPLRGLKDEIARCILGEDTMADDASADLKHIRNEYATAGGRIHKELNRMLVSYGEYLQDAIVTQRGERYCIPVKAEHKGRVPGIVHDTSSSGGTFFIEPAAIVELNNKLSVLKQQEEEEIRRILAALSAMVAGESESIGRSQHALTRLDFAFAKAKYALKQNAVRPRYNTEGRIVLKKARHPLLDPVKAVPIDVELGAAYDQLIITGPNTGGKTVSLKTVGLLCLMGQAGLHIPALDRSELALFGEVFADIGDEQSIEQSLSTFSSHMSSIVWILKKAGADSLVLFDELGAGTDPTEGAALAMAILSGLHERGIRCMATTHYSELKIYALSTDGVENAGCEFDVESLSPTYRLLVGIPGKSNAFAIARKLGLKEEIIEAAGQYLSSTDESFESVIGELNERRAQMESEQAAFEERQRELTQRLSELSEREDKLEAQKDKIISSAREEARELLQEAKDVADETIRAFNKQGHAMRMDTMEKKRSGLRQRIADQSEALWREEMKRRPGSEKKESVGAALSAKEALPGTAVHILSMDVDGVITAAPDKEGRVQVQAGIISTRVELSELVKNEKTKESVPQRRASKPLDLSRAGGVRSEINLLGCTVDEATAQLDKYLDDAYLSHAQSVRIVHGKGTGALRKGIHDYLRYNPVVKSFSLAEHGEGDAGVTIVHF